MVRPKQKDKADESRYEEIERLRRALLADHTILHIHDLGAGSKHGAHSERKVRNIARQSLSSASFQALYDRAIEYFGARQIVELGTSLGITTLYLAQGNGRTITTFEGAEAIADLAQQQFRQLDRDNIALIRGNIDEQLPHVITALSPIDFAFIDANHREEPTLRYFRMLLTKAHPSTVMVFDDIHDTPEMERAWRQIQRHPAVTATADLFRCGFVFFNPALNNQHVILQQ